METLPEIKVDNVVVFMADALRWDYHPSDIASQGTTAKTVAASLSTHTSLPTMLTGVHPQHHGITSWHGKLPNISSLLDVDGFDSGYYMPGDDSGTDGTFSVLNNPNQTSLDDLDSPFLYFERHHGGHSPFNASGWSGDNEDFIEEFSGNTEEHKREYKKAIDATVEDFNERMEQLYESFEAGQTLFIFTSDHGEFMGEGGAVGHGFPLRPEGVYVPTTFIHPDLPEGEVLDGVFRHVDLFPTILDAIDKAIPETCDGKSRFRTTTKRGSTMSVLNGYYLGRVFELYRALGVWDESGGFVFNQSSVRQKLGLAPALMLRSGWQATHLRRQFRKYPKFLSQIISNNEKYGDPKFEQQDARSIVEDLDKLEVFQGYREDELGEETQQKLKDLGYLK